MVTGSAAKLDILFLFYFYWHSRKPYYLFPIVLFYKKTLVKKSAILINTISKKL